VAVTPKGQVVSAGYDGRLLVWDPEHPDKPIELGRHDAWVSSVTVTLQGQVVSADAEGRVLVWDLEQKESSPGWMGIGTGIGTSRKVVTGGDDERLLVWAAMGVNSPSKLAAYLAKFQR
jgi:WD40 repeat protein